MSTVITPFQGIDSFSMATFNNRISQINTGFSYISNPNLLDNWYFGNPVNQRGQTSYTGTGYGIDRWWFSGTSSTPATVIIESDCVKLLATDSFRQLVENPSRFAGKKLTLSMLIEGVITGTGHTGFIVDNAWIASISLPTTTQKTLISVTADIPNNLNMLGAWYYGASGTEYKIYAAKLELGSTQTLAHQDADGNWVLNEIPDYGEQLRKCQRYFYKAHYVQYQTINAAYEATAYSFLALPIPVNMRVEKPVLTQSAPVSVGASTKTMATAEVKGCMAILGVNYDVIQTYAGSCYAYCPTADGVTFTLSADL